MITCFLEIIRIAIAGQQVECGLLIVLLTYQLLISRSSFLQWPELDNEYLLVNCVHAILIVLTYLVILQSRFIWTIKFAIAAAVGMQGSRTRGIIILIEPTFYPIAK